MCPCAEGCDLAEYARHAQIARRAIIDDPDLVLEPLAVKMRSLAAGERFEDAARLRDRASAFVTAIERSRRIRTLESAGTVDLRIAGTSVRLERGRFVDPAPTLLDDTEGASVELGHEEVLCVAAELDRRIDDIELLNVSGALASPLPKLPSFSAPRGT